MKPKQRWIVRPGDGEHVADVLAHLQSEPTDRVFVNGRPSDLQAAVKDDDVVELWPTRAVATHHEVQILQQQDDIVLLHKPAGIPCQTTQLGVTSVQRVLLERFPGKSVHIPSRLDTQVSGVMVATLGKAAAQQFQAWQAQKQYQRDYLALANGQLQDQENRQGNWQWPLGKRRDGGGRFLASPHAKHAKAAHTRFTVLACSQVSFFLLQPQTGRMHQLRAHAALAGVPLLGDRHYGGPTSVVAADGQVHAVPRVALHAWHITLPGRKATSPLPPLFQQLWQQLGGDPTLDSALNAKPCASIA